MRLLIVVDKLLTGFDAPSATYLYIDKKMQRPRPVPGHLPGQPARRRRQGLRLHRRLPRPLQLARAAPSPTTPAAPSTATRRRTSRACCPTGSTRRARTSTRRWSGSARSASRSRRRRTRCSTSTTSAPPSRATPSSSRPTSRSGSSCTRRSRALARAYGNLANEMGEAGYTRRRSRRDQGRGRPLRRRPRRGQARRRRGRRLQAVRGRHAPPARHLHPGRCLRGRRRLRGHRPHPAHRRSSGAGAIDKLPEGIKEDPEAVAETITNNVRKVIIDERPLNPKYYDKHVGAARRDPRGAAHRAPSTTRNTSTQLLEHAAASSASEESDDRVPGVGRQRRQASARRLLRLRASGSPPRSTTRSCSTKPDSLGRQPLKEKQGRNARPSRSLPDGLRAARRAVRPGEGPQMSTARRLPDRPRHQRRRRLQGHQEPPHRRLPARRPGPGRRAAAPSTTTRSAWRIVQRLAWIKRQRKQLQDAERQSHARDGHRRVALRRGDVRYRLKVIERPGRAHVELDGEPPAALRARGRPMRAPARKLLQRWYREQLRRADSARSSPSGSRRSACTVAALEHPADEDQVGLVQPRDRPHLVQPRARQEAPATAWSTSSSTR